MKNRKQGRVRENQTGGWTSYRQYFAISIRKSLYFKRKSKSIKFGTRSKRSKDALAPAMSKTGGLDSRYPYTPSHGMN